MIDSAKGAIYKVQDGSKTLDFSLHDEGYIRLEPFWRRYDNITAETTEGSVDVTLGNCDPDASFVGKYLRIDGGWKRIEAI